jgi:5-methylcytosine-specific restriction protein B
LTQSEAGHLTTLISEREPESVEGLDAEGSVGQWNLTTFHPSYSYEDFVEGFRPIAGSSGELALQLEDGLFKRLCLAARSDPERPYVLIIDEINRANLAKVFGELITLLEQDKRGVKVTLPQSKERFEVPPNVHVIGTMNTADRSTTLMDVALRRRFAFVELMPDPDTIEQTVGPLKLADFLAGLNTAVARVAGREKQIGHSYFMDGGQPIVDPEAFGRIFRMEILPLLQEYCFEEYEQLAEILGSGLVDVEGQSFKSSTLEDPDELLQTLAAKFSSSAAES